MIKFAFKSQLSAIKNRITDLETYNKGMVSQNSDLIKQNKLLWAEHMKNK